MKPTKSRFRLRAEHRIAAVLARAVAEVWTQTALRRELVKEWRRLRDKHWRVARYGAWRRALITMAGHGATGFGSVEKDQQLALIEEETERRPSDLRASG